MAAGKILYSLAAGPGKAFGIPLLMKLTGQKVIFPFYHALADTPAPHLKHCFHVRNTQQFCDDLDFFMKYYQPLTVGDLREAAKSGKKFDRPGFFITFDDGLASFYHTAAPILASRGLGAACFVNPSFADNKQLFYRYKVSLIIDRVISEPDIVLSIPSEYRIADTGQMISMLQKLTFHDTERIDQIATVLGLDFSGILSATQPYMTSEQIRELSGAGFTFGGHSMDHPLYASLPLEKQVTQTTASVDWVRSLTGQKTGLFSFPFTDHGVGNAFFDSVRDLDLTFGTAGLKSDPQARHFQRIPMETTHHSAETVIRTEYLYHLLKSPFGKNTVTRHG